MNQKYINFKQVFTDGSKDPITGVTGAAIVVPRQMSEMSRRTSDHLSVYAVELFAILMALEWIECTKSNRTLICSDSVSVLQSLKTGMVKNHQELLYDVMSIYSRIKNKGDEVILMWVPAHMGIIGNEKVDKIAKKALQKESIKAVISLSKSEGKSIVWEKIIKEWQQRWDQELKRRHLYVIIKRVGTVENKGGNRKETIMTRLRIGHNKLNSTLHIMGKHPTGFCDQCQIPETVEHVLINCSKYELQRMDMIKDMEKIELTGRGVKNIMTPSTHLSIISIFPPTLSFPILYPSTSIMCFKTIPFPLSPRQSQLI